MVGLDNQPDLCKREQSEIYMHTFGLWPSPQRFVHAYAFNVEDAL